ncbi:uncharacterized protein METZ01_LOCUS334322, partial [marine metagenome]
MTYSVISAATNIISIGNTGLRTKDPATEHIKILSALKDFRKIVPDGWEEEKEQKEFLKFIKENEIWDIKEDNKVPAQKDIRLKTSFLSDAGFTTEDRCITSAGEKLLNSSSSETTINKWLISNQSFIFFKQLLKFQQDNFKIQPLLSLIYCCLEFDNELPYEFLRTIWATASSREEVLEGIELYKSSDGNLKEYLLNRAKRSEQTKNVKNNLN